MNQEQVIENLNILIQKIFEKKPKNKSEAINQLAYCEMLLGQILDVKSNADSREILKTYLCQNAINFICDPEWFQKYRIENLIYNKNNHIIEFKDIIANKDKLPFLNSSSGIPGNEKFSVTLLLISMYINPKNFHHFKERELNHTGKFADFYNDENSFSKKFIETIFSSVENFISKNSGLDKTFLEKFIPKGSFDKNPYAELRDRVILNLFTLNEFRSFKEIIMYLVKETPSYFKEQFFELIDRKLFDDDEFLFDVAKRYHNYKKIPFGFASNRIKKNKLFALCACSLDGDNIFQFDKKFLSDKEVVMVAISKLPSIYSEIDPVMQKDE